MIYIEQKFNNMHCSSIYYSIRNSPGALLEDLFARIFLDLTSRCATMSNNRSFKLSLTQRVIVLLSWLWWSEMMMIAFITISSLGPLMKGLCNSDLILIPVLGFMEGKFCQKKPAVSSDLIPPSRIYVHMCNTCVLCTRIRIHICRTHKLHNKHLHHDTLARR